MMPEQSALLPQLSELATKRMLNPQQYLDPMRLSQRTQVNRSFSSLPDIIRQKYGTGAGSHDGRAGMAAVAGETARLGKLTDVDSNFQGLLLEEIERGSSLGERLLGMNFGSDVETDQTSEGTNVGTQVGPGSALTGGVSGGLETLMTLLTMNRMLGSGGFGGGIPDAGKPGAGP